MEDAFLALTPEPAARMAGLQRQMRQWGDVLRLHKPASRKAAEPEAGQGNGLLKLLGQWAG
jgi:hypothetical protein